MATRKGSTKAKTAKRTATRTKKSKAAEQAMRTCVSEAQKVTDAFRAKIEQIVFDWVAENLGIGEAKSPSWNIRELSNAIADGIVLGHEAKHKVTYGD